MTVVIGILNKRGVAIAADSAVTIGNGRHHKIFNDAEKLFELSKSHPVGILFYNSANFMMTPWEPIVKSYRNRLESKDFEKLGEYVDDFLNYLTSQFEVLADADTQEKFAKFFTRNIIDSVITDTQNKFGQLTKHEKPDDYEQYLRNVLDSHIPDNIDPKSCAIGFEDYTFEQFSIDYLALVKSTYSEYCNLNKFKFKPEVEERFIKLIYFCLVSAGYFESYTGLVFAGFGSTEIYPSLIAVEISGVFSNRLKLWPKDITTISNNGLTAAIKPYGQTDVIDTILNGVHPFLEDLFINTADMFISSYHKKTMELFKNNGIDLPDEFLNLETKSLAGTYPEILKRIKREKFIAPLMSTIDYLSKQDLAEMAESLIYLTYLKRRITNDEESVGGPVDVAVLSKGDGFIWIKKKNYFKHELNKHNNNI